MFTSFSTSPMDVSKDPASQLTPELFHKIADGDQDAFHLLYNETAKSIFGFLLSILHNREDAEDLLQETYIKVRLHAKEYTHQGKPLAWMLTIARNLAYMKLREQKKYSYAQVEDLNLEDTFQHIQNLEDRMVLEAAFRILDDEEREIVILHAISGLKHREISILLDKPLPTVLSKYHRSIKKLRQELVQRI